MPFPIVFTSSAPAGGRKSADFSGPVLFGKIQDNGPVGTGPRIEPSGTLFVQSTGGPTNQTISTAAVARASFNYLPVTTGTLISGGGPPPFLGFGSAFALVDPSTADRHIEMYSTSEGDWIRFAAASTQIGPFSTSPSGGSTFSLVGVWPQIGVFTSSGNNLGGYSDLTWTETDNILLAGVSTVSALFGALSSQQHNIYFIGSNNAEVTSSAVVGVNYDYNFSVGNANLFINAADSQSFGESNVVYSGPNLSFGNSNLIGPKTGSNNLLVGINSEINTSQGSCVLFGIGNRVAGQDAYAIGSDIDLSTGASSTIVLGVGVTTSSTDQFGTHSTHNNSIILSVGDIWGTYIRGGDKTYIYNQSSSGTAFGKTQITITSSSAQTVLTAASTAEVTGGTIGLYSAGSPGSTGTATLRLNAPTSGSTQALPLRFYESTGGNYVGLRAPSTMPAASYTLTLPSSVPSTGMVPIIDSSHVLKFGYLSGFSGTFVTSTAGTATVTNGIIVSIV